MSPIAVGDRLLPATFGGNAKTSPPWSRPLAATVAATTITTIVVRYRRPPPNGWFGRGLQTPPPAIVTKHHSSPHLSIATIADQYRPRIHHCGAVGIRWVERRHRL